MSRRSAAIACLTIISLAPSLRAEEPITAEKQKATIERGLTFLDTDAARWRKSRECATCHHGAMTAWVFTEARLKGFTIADEKYQDTVTWTKTRLAGLDKPRDTRPGWSMVNSISLYLSLMAGVLPGQDLLSAAELKQITGHLLRHQEENGSWSWSSAPPKNRPPPFFESDEVATLLGYLALGLHNPTDAEEQKAIHTSRVKAAAWLVKQKPTDTTQAAALRLLVKVRAKEPEKTLRPEIDAFIARQNKDGGWPQLPSGASDAYATGEALYMLNVAGIKPDRAEIQHGVTFLVNTQKSDGSWPMTPRSHEGATPAGNIEPITYFGTAWGTLGLMRSIPK